MTTRPRATARLFATVAIALLVAGPLPAPAAAPTTTVTPPAALAPRLHVDGALDPHLPGSAAALHPGLHPGLHPALDPVLAARSGASLADGAAVIGASAWHAAGYDGAGVRIGIIDGGFRGITDLPPGTFGGGIEARCFTAVGTYSTSVADCEETSSEHGTAVAETVAATAPRARILVANPISYNDLKATIGWMTSRGVRIVNASFNSGDVFEGPGDGTSPYSDAYYSLIDATVRLGALWVGAAGNSGDGGWSGPWVDADGDDWVDFAPDPLDPTQPDEANEFTMAAGSRVRIGLRWPDAWGRASDDLDLYLYPVGSDQPVASSTARQTGSGYPVERLTFRAPSAGSYEVAIRHRSGDTPERVQLLMETQGIVQGLEHRVPEGTLPAPADTANAGAIIVGAVDVRTPDVLEDYSSRGPTTDGRQRPDLVAPDCADTSIGAFCGTSQSTPYVSGAAALLLQADPSLTPAALAATLRARTVPLAGTSVPEAGSGWGRLSLGLPPAVPPAPTSTPPPTGLRTLSAAGAGQAWRGLAVGQGARIHVVHTDTSGASSPGSQVVYRGSTDGGAAFGDPVRLSSGSVDTTGAPVGAAHAAVAAGGSLVAAAWLEGAVGNGGETTVFVATSPDGGTTWGPGVAVSPAGGRAGRPALATDGVNVAVAWTERGSGQVLVATSPDGGATWPTQVVPATTTLAPFGSAFGRDALPTVALAGSTLHLAWSSTGSRLVYRRSTNLGTSWSAPVTLDPLAVGASRPWLAASGSSVAVAYAARPRSGGRMLAYVRTSGNGGATWNARSLVAATTALASSYPVVTIAGATVRVAYAGCTTSACARSRLWFRQSTNRGRTWSAAAGLSASTQNARPAGVAATSRVLVLYALNASTTTPGATIYLRVR